MSPVARKLLPLALGALLLGHGALAAEPDISSEPVSWAFVRLDGNSLSLDGVFRIALKGDGHWRPRTPVASPATAAVNTWDILSDDGTRTGMLAVVDVAIDKLPADQRGRFMRSLVNGFRRTGADAMAKKGYTLMDVDVRAVESRWPHSQMAVSKFIRGDDKKVSITYFFPAGRLYIISYEGASEGEPSWFTDTCQSLDCK